MNLPTKITLTRIFLIPVFAVLYLIPYDYLKFAAVFVFLIASLTDWLDGYLARKNNMVTDLGKFLDPVADKTLVACALILCCTLNTVAWVQIAVVAFSIVIISRELIITCFRTIAATKKVIMAADIWGKLKTCFQLIGLSIYLIYPAFAYLELNLIADIFMYTGVGFLTIATIFTIFSAINYIYTNRHVLKADEPSVKNDIKDDNLNEQNDK